MLSISTRLLCFCLDFIKCKLKNFALFHFSTVPVIKCGLCDHFASTPLTLERELGCLWPAALLALLAFIYLLYQQILNNTKCRCMYVVVYYPGGRYTYNYSLYYTDHKILIGCSFTRIQFQIRKAEGNKLGRLGWFFFFFFSSVYRHPK